MGVAERRFGFEQRAEAAGLSTVSALRQNH